jgi:fibronectin-binding autotransporter adhesin
MKPNPNRIQIHRQFARLTASLAVLALSTAATPAAPVTWDATPTTPGAQDGNGNWGTAANNTNWWNGTANVTWTNANGDTAVLGVNTATASTVTLTNKVTVGGITYSNAGTAAYTVAGGSTTVIPVAAATNLTFTGVSPTILLAGHNVTNGQVTELISASVIATSPLSVLASTTSTNSFLRFNNITNNFSGGALYVGTPGNATYGGTTALFIDFNTPTTTDPYASIINNLTNITVYSNAAFRISNHNSGSASLIQWPKQMTISGEGRQGWGGAWILTGNVGDNFVANVVLAGDSTIEINSGTSGLTYGLYGPISGTGRLQLVADNTVNSVATVVLTNVSTYFGSTLVVGGVTVQLTSGNDRLPTSTVLTLGRSDSSVAAWNRFGRLVLGNPTLAVNQTLAGLASDPTISGCQVAGGNSTNISVLTVANGSDDVFAGGLGGATAPTNMLALVKSGSGKLSLQGTNQCVGGYTINNGSVQFGDGFTDWPFGGAITNNAAVIFNVASSLTDLSPITGSGPLTKMGGGSLVLAGTNSYTGPTVLSAGKLTLMTTMTGGAILVTNAGTELEVQLSPGAPTLTAASASIDSSTLDFNLNLNSPSATAPLTVTSGFSNGGFTTINVLSFGPLSLGSFPLIKYGSYQSNDFSSLNLTSMGAGVTASVQNNPGNHSIDLVITALTRLKWSGLTDTNWDTTTTNWMDFSGLPTTYAVGDFALFDDSGTNTAIWLSSDPQPDSLTVSNNARAYSFNGVSGIGGSSALLKQGTGTLTVAVNNNNSGGTIIQKGTVQVGDGVNDGTITAPITDNGALIFNVVNSSTVGGITGTGTVTKAGAGQLTLGSGNTYAGATTVQQGQLLLTDSAALGATNVGTTISGGAETHLTLGGLAIAEPLALSGSGVSGGGAFIVDAGASSWSGPITASAYTLFAAAASGASCALSGGLNAGTNLVEFGPVDGAYFTVASNLTAGTVLLNNAGGLFLSSANDSLTNIVVAKANPTSGTISRTAGVTAQHSHALGTNGLVKVINTNLIGNSGAIVRLGNNANIPATVSLDATLSGTGASGPGAYQVAFGTLGAASTNTWNGPITIHGADPATGVTPTFFLRGDTNCVLVINGDMTWADGVGVVSFRGPTCQTVINGRVNLGTNNLAGNSDNGTPELTINSTGNTWNALTMGINKVHVGANNALPIAAKVALNNASAVLDLNGFNQQIGGLSSSVNATVGNYGTNTASTLTVSTALGSNWVYSGAIANVSGAKPLSLVVAGDTLTLSSAGNGYAGTTTIGNGATLALTNSGALTVTTPIDVQAGGTFDVSGITNNNGNFVLGTNQTLKGNGTVNGSLAVSGTLAPGESVGALTVTTNVTLNPAATTVMEVNNATATNDLLSVGGTLTYNGTLLITNISAVAYTNNQVLKLFSAATYGVNAFATIAFLGVGSYDASSLTVDGTIKVLSLLPSTPTNITFSLAAGGTQLHLLWPANYTGWLLQSNAVGIVNPSSWFTVPNSAATNQMFLPIDPSRANVFYRMRHP